MEGLLAIQRSLWFYSRFGGSCQWGFHFEWSTKPSHFRILKVKSPPGLQHLGHLDPSMLGPRNFPIFDFNQDTECGQAHKIYTPISLPEGLQKTQEDLMPNQGYWNNNVFAIP